MSDSRKETQIETKGETQIERESRASAAHTLPPLIIEDDYTRTYYVKDRELVTPIGKASTGPWRVECDTCGGSVTIKAIGELVTCRCGMHEFVLTDARPALVKDSSEVLSRPSTVQARKPRAAPTLEPAIEAFRRGTGKYPRKELWPGIVQVVGGNPDNVTRFEKVCLAYIACGWNPGNVKGMLGFYARNEIPGDDKPHSHSGSKSKNGNGSQQEEIPFTAEAWEAAGCLNRPEPVF